MADFFEEKPLFLLEKKKSSGMAMEVKSTQIISKVFPDLNADLSS